MGGCLPSFALTWPLVLCCESLLVRLPLSLSLSSLGFDVFFQISEDSTKGSKATLVYGQMNEPPGARARVALTGLTIAEVRYIPSTLFPNPWI